MFYRPGQDDHGLPRNPFNALITPRPIAWVSTRDPDGAANLAPFSFFNAAAYTPPIVSVAFTGAKTGDLEDERKDTLANIRATREFAVNIVPAALKDEMNASSAHLPAGENEFDAVGVTESPCELISAPRVAESPACFECRLIRLVELPNDGPGENTTVFGQVVGVHIADEILRDGFVVPSLFRPLARMGYLDYAIIEDVFAMNRPD
ncbi:flavin reductase family protein [Pikeienuella piscinae]|uniref:Flavin reductase family protein n=1 Tax=Pikeienuella piscinae TaxID=2748098 RepID=A0A7L5BWN2_9RHOB|nr:flavin reductase family protein [Pikeienuella piscinae]QIE56132.1 flavin reductase family protein [Pikeienuella piscinae]